MLDDLERTYGPTEAAELIDFAPSLLRRYAGIYESLGNTIARDKRGGRMYTRGVLDHFAYAREQVRKGELLETALRTVDDWLEHERFFREPLGPIDAKQVLGLLQQLADENQSLRSEIRELSAKVSALTERPQIGAIDESETARMNRYLLGELERRRLKAEAAQEPRRWWRFWSRR